MRPIRWRRRPKGDQQVAVEMRPRTGPPPGPEILPWYWHPNREGARPCPAEFDRRLKEIHPDLYAVFSPVHERWIIWARNPRRQNSVCAGWQLLFLWEHPVTHDFLPLDELVFKNIYFIYRDKYPNAQQYFANIEAEAKARKEAQERQYQNNRRDSQQQFWDSTKISTAGKGNKAALHHSGTIVESPGEAAWRAETRKWRLSREVLQREADEKEKRFYGSY